MDASTGSSQSYVEVYTMTNYLVNSSENDSINSTGSTTAYSGQNELELPSSSQAVYLASILVPVFFSVIFCVGVLGNSLVITVMTKMYRHQPQGLNNTNRFILNLAISDLFFLVFCVPFQAPIYSTKGWPFGGFMCVFCEFCQNITMLASVYTLAALSFDRFFAVVYATSAKQLRTRSNANRGLIFIWVAAIGIATPSALTRVQVEYEGYLICVPNWKMIAWYKWYQLSIFVLGYVIPLLIIMSCYMGVLYAMCQNARSSAVVRSKSAKGSRKRVTRVVIMVVIFFAIDWFPHHLTTLWLNFGTFPYTSATFVLKLLAHCLSYANSCVNPLIYAFVSNRFRADFKKAFTCQYLSEAVGSMKAYSRRFVESFSAPLRTSQSEGGNKEFKPRPPIISASSFRLSNKKRKGSSLKRHGSEITSTTVIQINTSSEPSPRSIYSHKNYEQNNAILNQEIVVNHNKEDGIDCYDLNCALMRNGLPKHDVTALIHNGIPQHNGINEEQLFFQYPDDVTKYNPEYDDVSDDDIFGHDKDFSDENRNEIEMIVSCKTRSSEQQIL